MRVVAVDFEYKISTLRTCEIFIQSVLIFNIRKMLI